MTTTTDATGGARGGSRPSCISPLPSSTITPLPSRHDGRAPTTPGSAQSSPITPELVLHLRTGPEDEEQAQPRRKGSSAVIGRRPPNGIGRHRTAGHFPASANHSRSTASKTGVWDACHNSRAGRENRVHCGGETVVCWQRPTAGTRPNPGRPDRSAVPDLSALMASTRSTDAAAGGHTSPAEDPRSRTLTGRERRRPPGYAPRRRSVQRIPSPGCRSIAGRSVKDCEVVGGAPAPLDHEKGGVVARVPAPFALQHVGQPAQVRPHPL